MARVSGRFFVAGGWCLCAQGMGSGMVSGRVSCRRLVLVRPCGYLPQFLPVDIVRPCSRFVPIGKPSKQREKQRMAKLTRKQIKEGLDALPLDGVLFGSAALAAAEARLTPKQKQFARMVALGESKAGAYRKAYNSKGNPRTVAVKGCEMSKRDNIAGTIEAFKQAQAFAEQHTPAQIRAFVIQQLTSHAQNDDNPPAQRIKALELLGKVAEVGAFVDRKEIVSVQSSQTVRERLLEKLKAVGSGTTIDHAPAPDDGMALLDEIEAGRAAIEQDNCAPEPEAAGFDPTGSPPPDQPNDHPQTYTHTIPDNQSSVFSEPSVEAIGIDVHASPHIVEGELIVANVPAEDPTPSV